MKDNYDFSGGKRGAVAKTNLTKGGERYVIWHYHATTNYRY